MCSCCMLYTRDSLSCSILPPTWVHASHTVGTCFTPGRLVLTQAYYEVVPHLTQCSIDSFASTFIAKNEAWNNTQTRTWPLPSRQLHHILYIYCPNPGNLKHHSDEDVAFAIAASCSTLSTCCAMPSATRARPAIPKASSNASCEDIISCTSICVHRREGRCLFASSNASCEDISSCTSACVHRQKGRCLFAQVSVAQAM